MSDIASIFGAQSMSVLGLFGTNGQCLYIPAYQRQYSWKDDEINRLISDIKHGFQSLLKNNNAFTFLGSVITVKNKDNKSIYPISEGQLPTQVVSVIDGQQRTTTLLIIATALHDLISMIASSYKQSSSFQELEEDAVEWLEDKILDSLGMLKKSFEEEQNAHDAVFKYYPRMIRAYDDRWGRRKSTAEYNSPIANHLHQFGLHIRAHTASEYEPTSNSNEGKQEASLLHSGYKNSIESIKKIIDEIANATGDEHFSDEATMFDSIIENKIFQSILLKTEIFEGIRSKLIIENDLNLKKLVLLMLFANYFLDRVAVTVVTSENEDYAFDIFESLNTTGEPLTAFETFKPKVIKDVGIEAYLSEDPEIKDYLESVEQYLEKNKKQKQKNTRSLIIYFGLLYNGKALSTKLSEQRGFFRETYEELPKNVLSFKTDYVHYFSLLKEFVEVFWSCESDNYKDSYLGIDQQMSKKAKVCLAFLKDFEHTIVIAPLARFYMDYYFSDGITKKEVIQNFESAIYATVAFSVLWRSSRITTDRIDGIYRSFMLLGCSESGLGEMKIDGFSTQRIAKLDLTKYKKALIHKLEAKGDIQGKADWVEKASVLPLYKIQREVTKFLLFAASDNTIVDMGQPSLLCKSRQGVFDLLDIEMWRADIYGTVEHIAPQRPKVDSDVVDDSLSNDTIHRLGNLTLLPAIGNIINGNRPWDEKKVIFKILSIKNDAEWNDALDEAIALGIKLSSKEKEHLRGMKQLPMLDSLANYKGSWGLEIIDKRSKGLADLAWDQIIRWLSV